MLIRNFLVSTVGRLLRRWDPDDAQTLLSQFAELHRQGKLSYEEYREVQIVLAEQVESRAEAAENKKPNKRKGR